MKKIALYVLTCVLLLSFFSCSTENNDADSDARKFGVKPKSISADKIVYKTLKKENYPNLVTVNEELALIRQNFDSGLHIKDEVALYTAYEGKHTYTFKTDRADRKENEIENIVLESRADGKYNSYYFKYNFTSRELADLDKLPTTTILANTEIVPLVLGNGGGLINISCFEAVQNYVEAWQCEAGNPHEPGNPNCQAGGSMLVLQPSTLSYVYVGCDGNAIGGGGSGGGSGSGSGGSSGGGGTGSGGTGSGGSSGGGSGSGGSDNESDPETDPDYSFVEGQTIITQPVQLNPIVQILLDPTFTENDCLNGVYEQLGGSPTFQNYLQNFDGDFSVANLKLSADQMEDGNYAITLPPYNYVIEIIFDTNMLSNIPTLDVACTFIHEMIHAEMYRKLLSVANDANGNISFTTETIQNLRNNFIELHNYYMLYFFNVPEGEEVTEAQHELMAQHYRSVIEDALREFDPTQTDAVYEAIAWDGLMGSGGDVDLTTGLPPYPTVAWANVNQEERLQIISTYENFKNSNPSCQN